MTLPKFKNPPVVEVALSVQFKRPDSFSVAHLGLIWERFRSRFPNVEQHGPVGKTIERRGARNSHQRVQFSITTAEDDIPRLWMVSADSHELLQLQSDRFARNWRRYHNKAADYPSWDGRIRDEFCKDFSLFRETAEKLGWGELQIEQCEVTYVNHVRPNEGWTRHDQLSRIFKGWSSSYPNLAGSPAEGIGVRTKHEMADKEGNFLGRLHVEIDSGFLLTDDSTPIFLIQLIARGQPVGSGVDGVTAFMDLGHQTIVTSFADLTTDEMHKAWGRTQ